jgi:hypothetical protein|tara:strand:+ start:147 stop:455 length:309 start_codon:yes stop_codon:yes gene_type:complete|mmetsp:Transcript_8349/g.27386  ORF Transcript_8349/g.27386 Transcript_8349/m.27386 type:complete len:103 (-) Transcript_8349:825-1133(-)
MYRYLLAICLRATWGEYTPKIDPKSFELWRLKVEKKVKTTERAHRIHFLYRGQTISPWHDIPFWAGYSEEDKQPLLHFVSFFAVHYCAWSSVDTRRYVRFHE